MILSVQVVLQILLAVFLGSLIGLEREMKGKNAGFQTYSLVALGSCVFTIIFYGLFNEFGVSDNVDFDPSRIIQAIAIGVGFIGAGTIFRQESEIQGLTTAAGLWATSAVGILAGINEYFLAAIVAFVIIFIFIIFGNFERKIKK